MMGDELAAWELWLCVICIFGKFYLKTYLAADARVATASLSQHPICTVQENIDSRPFGLLSYPVNRMYRGTLLSEPSVQHGIIAACNDLQILFLKY
jgi:hypothetical protein